MFINLIAKLAKLPTWSSYFWFVALILNEFDVKIAVKIFEFNTYFKRENFVQFIRKIDVAYWVRLYFCSTQ